MAKPKSRDETTTARNSRGKRPRKPARARKSTSANRPRAAAPRLATRLPDAPSPLTSSPVGSIAPRIDHAPTILRTALPAIDWAEALAPPATTPEAPLQQEIAQPIRRHLTRMRERQRERVMRLARIVAAALLALPGRIALLSVRVLTVSARAVTHALHPAVRTLTSVSRTAVAMGLAAFSVAVVVGAWLVFYFWVLAVPGAAITAAQPEPTSHKQFYDRIAPTVVATEPPAAAAAPEEKPASEGMAIKDTPPADGGSNAQASAAGAPEAEMPTGTVPEAAPAPVVPKAEHHKPGRAAARGAGKSKRRTRWRSPRPGFMVSAMRLLLAVAAIHGAALGMSIATPAHALDLNALRAQHKLPPLSYSATLAGAAYEHARNLAQRGRLDHDGFRKRVGALVAGTAAENVSYGCDDQPCAIQQWAKSSGHRRNMLLKGITAYGIASARADNGRRYWVMVLGN